MPYPQQSVNDTVHWKSMSTHHQRIQPHTPLHIYHCYIKARTAQVCDWYNHTKALNWVPGGVRGTVQTPLTSCMIWHKMGGMQMHNHTHLGTRRAWVLNPYQNTHTEATHLQSSTRHEMRRSQLLPCWLSSRFSYFQYEQKHTPKLHWCHCQLLCQNFRF